LSIILCSIASVYCLYKGEDVINVIFIVVIPTFDLYGNIRNSLDKIYTIAGSDVSYITNCHMQLHLFIVYIKEKMLSVEKLVSDPIVILGQYNMFRHV
jgi:hypothetical protein